MKRDKPNITIAGQGFGKEFIPIYQKHPDTNMPAIRQRTKEKLDQVGDPYRIGKRCQRFEDLIQHPHLVNEFVSSIVAGRPSFPDVYQSVNWTSAGINAHESALQDGRRIALSDFRSEAAAG